MNKLLTPATAGLLCLLLQACLRSTTDPGPASFFSARSSSCMAQPVGSVHALDSVFIYSFKDSLVLDFSVIANCCPDSNRFSISQVTGTDTLVITVADTAMNLCRCVCPYLIHARFEGLPQDRYIVICRICDEGNFDDPLYLVEVVRTR